MNQSERRIHDRTSFRQNSSCKMKHLTSGAIFWAEIADLSIKGMRLKFPSVSAINSVTDSPGNLLILETSLEKSEIELPGRTVIILWQDGLELGCTFI